jgi:hypothetical protein
MSGVVADPGLGQFQNGLQLINKPCRFLKKFRVQILWEQQDSSRSFATVTLCVKFHKQPIMIQNEFLDKNS